MNQRVRIRTAVYCVIQISEQPRITYDTLPQVIQRFDSRMESWNQPTCAYLFQ